MKITNEQLNSTPMKETVDFIYATAKFPKVGSTYRVLKIKNALDKEVEAGRELFKKVLEAHVVYEDGQPKASDEGTFELKEKTPEAKAAYEAAHNDFMAHEIDLGDLKQISLQEVESSGLRLSPRQLDAVLPFLSGVEGLDEK